MIEKILLFLIKHFGVSAARLVPKDLLVVIEQLGDEADAELSRRHEAGKI